MQIKRYETSSIQEAILKIKNDLGENAVLLSTKKLRGGRSPLFEVTAGTDEARGERAPAPGRTAGGPVTAAARACAEDGADEGSLIRRELAELKSLVAEATRRDPLYGEILELKESLSAFFDMLGLHRKDRNKEPLSRVYCRLAAGGMSKDRAYQLVNALRKRIRPEAPMSDEEALRGAEDLLSKALVPSYPKGERRRITAFVGPTGVGKTTTLAKLAARYALEEKKKVGLITADTYRIAAVEQLKTYAKILGVPVEVAAEKDEFKAAVLKFRDRDVILVDTPGRSRSDERYIEKLRDYLRLDVPVATDLLLSLTSSPENLLEATSRYEKIPYESLIFTKLDECSHFGRMYNVVNSVGKPVSYVTHGQNVPQDIEKVNAGRLARMIVRNTLH